MKSFFKITQVIILLFALTLSSEIYALAPPPGPGIPPQSVPLDGGLSFLLAGAAFFGVKKLRDSRKIK